MTEATAPVADATAPAAPAPAPTAAPDNVLVFRIPNTETDISVNIAEIPAETRLDFLKKAIRDYVANATNQTNMRAKKANEPFDLYDEAVKADPLQSAVAKPDGERTVPDLLKAAADARARLYAGEVKKQGDGTPRSTVDPLTKLVTEAVVRELFAKRKEADNKTKYTDITSEISKAGGGVKFLEAQVAAKVAAAPEAEQAALKAQLDKFMDERYMKPARMMLGETETKATKDVSLF